MRASVTELGYAKINLFLEVKSKRSDGYHELDSIMQSVSLADTVTVTVTDGDGILVECDSAELPTDSGNIAYRAIELYNRTYGIKARTECRINKRIPIAAGLAGGSTDAAAVLRALHRIHRRSTKDELLTIARELGADVPFCLIGGIARTGGIGEVMSACPKLTEAYAVIACPNDKISTAEAYKRIDSLPERRVRSADSLVAALSDGDLTKISAELFNIFEEVTEYSTEIKRIMTQSGAAATLMSGSGPSVFGLFAGITDAEKARDAIIEGGSFACVATPTDKLPIFVD